MSTTLRTSKMHSMLFQSLETFTYVLYKYDLGDNTLYPNFNLNTSKYSKYSTNTCLTLQIMTYNLILPFPMLFLISSKNVSIGLQTMKQFLN